MLSDIFTGVVAKKLTLVETITKKSNQHEIQGTKPLKALFGLDDRRHIHTRFVWLSGEQEAISEEGFMSWSNVRKGKPRAPEYHLYYSGNPVTELMQVGDTLFLALQRDGTILAVVTSSETIRNQLLWLFDIDEIQLIEPVFQLISGGRNPELDFTVRYILEELGIEAEEPEAALLDEIIEPLGLVFPKTRVFSELARKSLPRVSAKDDADQALVDWMDREEQLFRRLERRIVADRIANGFNTDAGADVEGFISFSLSVQNRRKARAGQALENHLEAIFIDNNIRYARGVVTENKFKPDFIFPGKTEYDDSNFLASKLTMLGVKSTLKDRWRQVLSEAERIKYKHLLTLEPGISVNQTDQMRDKSLQLVVPQKLQATYQLKQQQWLLNLKQFISVVNDRQKTVG